MSKIVYEHIHNTWKVFLEQQQQSQINVDSITNELMDDAKTLGNQAKQRSFKVSKSKVNSFRKNKQNELNEEVLSAMGIASILFAIPEVCVLITKIGKGVVKKFYSDPKEKTPILDWIEHFAHNYHDKLIFTIKKLLQALYFVFSGMSNDTWNSLGDKNQQKMSEIVHKAVIAYMTFSAGEQAFEAIKNSHQGLASYEGFMTALKSGTLERAVINVLKSELTATTAVTAAGAVAKK